MLRDDMPRSLHSCMNFIYETLDILCDEHSRELSRQAGELHARLHYGRTDEHHRLRACTSTWWTSSSGSPALGGEISRVFLVPTY